MQSDDLGLVPVAWRCEEIVGGGDWIYSNEPHTGYEPVYDSAAIERLVAERDEAREALKPFAKIAEEIQEVLADEKKPGMWATPTAGDLRRARQALGDTL